MIGAITLYEINFPMMRVCQDTFHSPTTYEILLKGGGVGIGSCSELCGPCSIWVH